MNAPVYLLKSLKTKRFIGFEDSGTHYICGFEQKIHAYFLKRYITNTTQVKLYQKDHLSVNIEDTEAPLFLVSECMIKFEKTKEVDEDLQIGSIQLDNFYALPFEDRIGIALFKDLMEDTEDTVSFRMHMLDPFPNLELD